MSDRREIWADRERGERILAESDAEGRGLWLIRSCVDGGHALLIPWDAVPSIADALAATPAPHIESLGQAKFIASQEGLSHIVTVAPSVQPGHRPGCECERCFPLYEPQG